MVWFTNHTPAPKKELVEAPIKKAASWSILSWGLSTLPTLADAKNPLPAAEDSSSSDSPYFKLLGFVK
jgi:hypothetical protein